MSVVNRLTLGEPVIDFKRWWRRGLVFSAVLIVLSIGSLFTRGLNLGIDFRGGTSWQVAAPGVTVDQARDALSSIGEGEAKVQIVGQDTLRVQARVEEETKQDEITDKLAELAKVDRSQVGISTVGSSWGSDVTRSAIRALVVFFILIFAYLAWRLEWKMALGAVAAVVHDIVISVGIYSIFQFEVTPATVIAFLTILGYSIYDTIVVFDKVQENQGKASLSNRMTYEDMVAMSMNQVLIRSLNTSVTALLPVLATLVVGSFILGAVTLEEFAIALTVGLTAGAYSSIFIAAPVMVWAKEREPRYRQLRERLEGRADTVVAEETAEQSSDASEGSAAGAPRKAADRRRTPAPSTAIPPRPRKKPTKRG